jgi:hypothetical protein
MKIKLPLFPLFWPKVFFLHHKLSQFLGAFIMARTTNEIITAYLNNKVRLLAAEGNSILQLIAEISATEEKPEEATASIKIEEKPAESSATNIAADIVAEDPKSTLEEPAVEEPAVLMDPIAKAAIAETVNDMVHTGGDSGLTRNDETKSTATNIPAHLVSA